MVKSGNTFGLPALLLGSALGMSAFAQSSTPPAQTAQDQAAPSSSSSAMNVTMIETIDVIQTSDVSGAS